MDPVSLSVCECFQFYLEKFIAKSPDSPPAYCLGGGRAKSEECCRCQRVLLPCTVAKPKKGFLMRSTAAERVLK